MKCVGCMQQAFLCAIIDSAEFKDTYIYTSLCSNEIFIFQVASDMKVALDIASYTPVTELIVN